MSLKFILMMPVCTGSSALIFEQENERKMIVMAMNMYQPTPVSSWNLQVQNQHLYACLLGLVFTSSLHCHRYIFFFRLLNVCSIRNIPFSVYFLPLSEEFSFLHCCFLYLFLCFLVQLLLDCSLQLFFNPHECE